MQTTTDLATAADGASVIIETVAEDRDAKRRVLEALGECAAADALIGTNSSTLPSSLFADVVPNAERLLNVHFMNPAMVMPLVEVVRGAHTSEATVLAAVEFARSIGKSPVLVERESFGFVANRILFIAMQEAFSLVENGYVSVEDCDLAVRNGLGWPMGPFEIADLVGLDVTQAILEEGHRQTGEPRWSPPALLNDRVARGELGRKTGQGFTLPQLRLGNSRKRTRTSGKARAVERHSAGVPLTLPHCPTREPREGRGHRHQRECAEQRRDPPAERASSERPRGFDRRCLCLRPSAGRSPCRSHLLPATPTSPLDRQVHAAHLEPVLPRHLAGEVVEDVAGEVLDAPAGPAHEVVVPFRCAGELEVGAVAEARLLDDAGVAELVEHAVRGGAVEGRVAR